MLQAVTLRPLVELLRIRYAPVRFDFGPRYPQSDLPAAYDQRLNWMAFPADGSAVLERQAVAIEMFNAALSEIDAYDVITKFEDGLVVGDDA